MSTIEVSPTKHRRDTPRGQRFNEKFNQSYIRTTVQLPKDTSTKLGIVARAEQPPTTKLYEVAFLVDKRYSELQQLGRLK